MPEEGVHLSEAGARLLGELLHAMGQPLTILQMCRLSAALPDLERDSASTLLPEMAEQVERVTDLYRGVRILFEAEAGAVQNEAVSLGTLLCRLEPEWQRRAGRRSVQFLLEPHEGTAMPALNATRGEEALTCLFEAVLASVPDRATMRWSWFSDIGVNGLLAGGGPVPPNASSGTLSLRIAEALFQVDGCRLGWEYSPLRVRLELP